jgi:5-methylcytosine-specific restriction endonuclease McrA
VSPDDTTPLKYCPKGDHYLPATTEYFYYSHGKLAAPCKACKAKHDKESGNKQRWFAANPEKRRASVNKYGAKNRERMREYHTEYQREWRKHNKEKERSYRVRRRSTGGKHTAEDIKLQLASQRGNCWWCGKKLKDDWHVDHRVPLARGGSNNANNLCISCPTCNKSKGAKMPHEWNGRLL